MQARKLVPALVAAAALAVPASAAAASDTIVISEVQFRGIDGNDEFVELQNVSSAPVPIGGWILQGCAAASGAPSARTTVPAGTSVPPGGHYLFVNSAGTLAFAADRTYGTGLSDDGGVRIVNGTTVIDGVANQDTSADQCREGAGLPFPTTSGRTNAFERTRDTDDNATDFDGPKLPDPQNSHGDVVDPGPAVAKIHDVQGAGSASPLAGRFVTVEGVVTGVDDEIGANFERTFPGDAGIFVQEEDADADADPATSEGVFVGFVRPRSAYPPGTRVRLEGRVVEQFDETRINLTQGSAPQVLGTAPIPAPVTIDPAAALAQPAPARPYYESLEGMNVLVDVGTATSGGRNKFGETFLTLGVNQDPEDRVFRTESAPDLIAADADAGAGDPDNPLVNTDSTTELPVDLFDVVRGLEGPLAFAFSNYRVINQERRAPVVEKGPTPFPYTLAPRAADQLRVASFNVENFFPAGTELDLRTVTQEEYEEKRDKIADAIANRLSRPDVIAVQEVYDLASLQDLADRLGGYTAYLEPGNDERGIDVGFLIADGVEHANVRQLGKDAAGPAGFTCSDAAGRLFDRPPLAVDVERRGVRFTLFSNHFSSKSAPDECRAAQAAFVRDEVAKLEAEGREAIVAGDLNAFEDESALTTLQDGTTSLDDLWDVPPPAERYSYHFDGRLQTLDHVLITEGLQPRVADFRYAHFDNDYYERRGVTDGHHVSDHDPPVLTVELPSPPVNTSPPTVSGDGKRNHELTGTPGEWTVDEGEIALAYRWLRCADETLGSCAPIEGATDLEYVPVKADKRTYLRLEVTASAPGGETVLASDPVWVK
jgi:predicted extracellular nuclease